MNHLNFQLGNLFLLFTLIFIILLYIYGVLISNDRYKKWPVHRTVLWISGMVCVAAAVIGPIAEHAHKSFPVHMVGHLLLGMVAPLLLVMAKPITLLLRSLPLNSARTLSRILKSGPVRFYSYPIITSILNVGGLWILYTTNLYGVMHHNPILFMLIHIHVFVSGYLFTASMIYFDPVSHRFSFMYRSIVLIFALAGHGILSKYIYAHPPLGVSPTEAEFGGMLMYYGGDFIDLVLIFILCHQWFKATKHKSTVNLGQ